MPRWIHARAKHLLAKNPDMSKSQAFAIATQQAHASGKTPKKFGTKKGKQEAKAKFDKPKKEYEKRPNPGSLKSPKLAAMRDELEKQALHPAALGAALAGGAGALGGALGAEKGSRLKGALKGGAAGALVGGAAGAGAGKALSRRAAKVAPQAARAAKAVPGAAKAAPTAKAVTKLPERMPSDVKTMMGGAGPSKTIAQAPSVTTQALGTPVAARGNLTAATGAKAAETYKKLPKGVQKALEGSDLVQAGVPPEMAMQLAYMSRQKGEDVLSAISRHALSGAGSTRSGIRAASPTMATAMGKAASALSADQIAAMRKAIEDNVEVPSQAKNIDRVVRYINTLKEKKAEGLSGDDPYLLDQVGKDKTRKLSAMPPNKSLISKQAMIPGAGAFAQSVKKGLMSPAKKLQQSQLIGVPKMKQMKVEPLKVKMSEAPSLGQHLGVGGAVGGGLAGIPLTALAGPKAGAAGAVLGGLLGAKTGLDRYRSQARKHEKSEKEGKAFEPFIRAAQRAKDTGEKQIIVFSPEVAPPGMKVGFAVSQYSGTLGPGRGPKYESHIPPFVNPPVKTAGPPSEKKKTKTAAMLDEICKLNAIQSPESKLTKSQKIGAPKASGPPGPSIQQIAKPLGYGKPLPGATKPQQGV